MSSYVRQQVLVTTSSAVSILHLIATLLLASDALTVKV